MYKKLGYVPLNVDLVMNNISLEEGPGGYYAIYGRTARDLGEGELSRSLLQRAAKKVSGREGRLLFPHALICWRRER